MSKIIKLDKLVKKCTAKKKQKNSCTFVTGVFDLLHIVPHQAFAKSKKTRRYFGCYYYTR